MIVTKLHRLLKTEVNAKVKKDFIQFITGKYTLLTDSEKMLSDYIIQNFEHVLTSSIHTLAKETNVSIATVVRFAQHLGFEGYKDFRLYLAQCGNEQEDFILDFSKGEKSPEAQISKMLSSCSDCLSLTQQTIDYSLLSEISESIYNADKIVFFGVETSYIVCQDAKIKFNRIGVIADCACEESSASAILLNMKKGDVVFGISHSGNNSFVEAVLKSAR
jgi:DNA-binding MurR/RpiR family transcriptional regulator